MDFYYRNSTRVLGLDLEFMDILKMFLVYSFSRKIYSNEPRIAVDLPVILSPFQSMFYSRWIAVLFILE